MAKYKAAGSRKKSEASTKGLIPCLILIIGGFAIIGLLFYLLLNSG